MAGSRMATSHFAGEIMRIENWAILYREQDPYLAPELRTNCVGGNVHDNPKFTNGTYIHTSSIEGKRGNKIVTHSGSEYELGEPNPEYEKIYPDARNRVFNSLKEV